MAQKKTLPAPVDKPLQKAYLREFTGWSTAYPPGNSEPTSCRVMENVMVNRNGSIRVRPGLRYASYEDVPDIDALVDGVPGVAYDRPFVGSVEPFYLQDGSRALLCGVRETDDTVGFRAIVFTDTEHMVYALDDPKIGFYCPQGLGTLRFSAACKYITYLQIDNKILALSDTAESMRYFSVGVEKIAKRLNSVTVPEWDDAHKPSVLHPANAWINKNAYTVRRNELPNPSFEAGIENWNTSPNSYWQLARPGRTGAGQALQIWTLPQRTNLATSPLHNVSATGTVGWHSGKGDPVLSGDGDWMKIFDKAGKDVFLAYSAKLANVQEGRKYHLAFNLALSNDAVSRARLQFYRNNGSEIGDQIKFFPDIKSGRWVSPAVEAPNNAAFVRIWLGADSTAKKASWAKVKNVMLCRANESTDFFSGNSGEGFYWGGVENAAPSWYWPTINITITSGIVNIAPGSGAWGSVYAKCTSGAKGIDVTTTLYDRDRVAVMSGGTSGTTGTSSWTRHSASTGEVHASAVAASLTITVKAVAPFTAVLLDDAMIEPQAVLGNEGAYFDGSSASTNQIVHTWEDPHRPHRCPSIWTKTIDLTAIPEAETPNTNTLVSSDATKNTYKMGFFYCFETEIGESAPSKVTEVRMMRPQSNWLWVTPSSNGNPSTSPTSTADLCADQLVVVVPEAVYTKALASGAMRWNLYAFSWSDTEPVPVEAALVGTRELFPDETSRQANLPLLYAKGGWINVTPARKFTPDLQPLPTLANRVNYSKPPKARNGIVAGDRIVVVADLEEQATIRWTSNRPAGYTQFTAHRGGGVKTLSAGNLNIPVAAALWQNPQSVDTLTLLCLGSDGTSSCYYMAPGELNTQSSYTGIMGFEETTNTPGTTSPFGVIVHNNALFRPIDYALLKSTAQNYNINHKTLSDNIANMWEGLKFKNWIISAEHDNRLYFLVNNPLGEAVEDGCLGNEIWVYDTAGGEKGTWSRFLVQAASLRIIDYGARVFMGVIRPDGMFYLDPEARQDDYVLADGTVEQRPISWFFEMNTQGSNRARDAWAHLQQLTVKFGSFSGRVRYGIRGRTVHGKEFEAYKVFTDDTFTRDTDMEWDIEDHLLIRRDLKEWYFSAGSVDGEPSSGRITFVQYRFSPVTVNVGYEYGSVETFEYGRDTLEGDSVYSTGGIPTPVQNRAWQRT